MHWKDLIPSFACPECRQPLALQQSDGKDELKCVGCRRVYPVEDDIPILLVDRAKMDV